ncbi:alpha-tocopherol transfer protein-like [Hyposmocoma kahamanoa]|uniref:alpha-tocopherol transfer protein-like n=1 Tax=Hyposmocoma kahamanoa TaxID=1477025 RepID=UPI000E6DA538|nr:alpha-tocopherol transfer protein-like [Hyposmocoma kahamanoa]
MTVYSIEQKSGDELSKDANKLLNITSEDIDVILKTNCISKTDLKYMVCNIKDWYQKQPHLPQGALNDEIIIRRLVTQSFSVEKVKKKVDNYYTIRRKVPEVLCNRDPLSPPVDKCLKQGYWVVLPKKTPDNKRVNIYRSTPSSDIIVMDIIKVAFMIGDFRLHCDDMGGDHWIFDFKHNTLQQASQFNPLLIMKIMFYLNYCFGPKVVGMHLVNLPPFAATILAIFKKHMTAKMVQRLHTYEKFDELYDVIPKNIFPKEYGGDEKSCQEISDEWMKTFQSSPWREYFIAQDNVCTDESKRLGPTKTDELFGVAGSFRKLDID